MKVLHVLLEVVEALFREALVVVPVRA